MAGSIILHKHFTVMTMKQIQHMLLQCFSFKFRHSFLFFGQEVKATSGPTHFTRKISPNHDGIWLFNS